MLVSVQCNFCATVIPVEDQESPSYNQASFGGGYNSTFPGDDISFELVWCDSCLEKLYESATVEPELRHTCFYKVNYYRLTLESYGDSVIYFSSEEEGTENALRSFVPIPLWEEATATPVDSDDVPDEHFYHSWLLTGIPS